MTVLSPAEQEVVAKVEAALAEVRQGGVTSIAILAIGANGFAVSTAGNQGADLNLAADSLKAKIVEVMNAQQEAMVRRAKSNIIRPRPLNG